MLAQAGILNGKRVTTHWIAARELKERYPRVKMEEDRIFIIYGSVWTSAGMTACIDLALGMVEKDHGADLARSVAQKLVMYHRRAGGQPQHSELLKMNAKSDRIQSALECARRNLKSALARTTRRCHALEPASVQPGLPRRDRSISCQSGRDSPPGGGSAHGGAEPPLVDVVAV